MVFMNLWLLWLTLAMAFIGYAAWSARRYGEMVIENVAENDSDETLDDLPFWQVKFCFVVGVAFAIAFMLSVAGLVLEYVYRIVPAGVDVFGALFRM